jgi:Domain of unknown function (DUF4123)
MFSLDHRTFLTQDFGIIDPLWVDAALWKHLPATPLGEKEFDCDVAQLPQLLCLREADELARLALLDAVDHFTANEDTPLFSALVRSSESASTLAKRLSRLLVLSRGLRGQKYLFRYFDPRVFLHLPRILHPTQMHALLAPASAWAWVNPLTQRWQEHLVAPVQAEAGEDVPAWRASLRLDDKQLDAIARIELVNRVLRCLRTADPQSVLDESLFPTIDSQALAAIEAQRLDDIEDQTQFVLDALEYGTQVHQAPEVHRILDGARSKQMSYAAGVNALGRQGMLAAAQSAHTRAVS